MMAILDNIRRIFSDDGRHDRDFSIQERQLQDSRQALLAEADALKKQAEVLADLIRLHAS